MALSDLPGYQCKLTFTENVVVKDKTTITFAGLQKIENQFERNCNIFR